MEDKFFCYNDNRKLPTTCVKCPYNCIKSDGPKDTDCKECIEGFIEDSNNKCVERYCGDEIKTIDE